MSGGRGSFGGYGSGSGAQEYRDEPRPQPRLGPYHDDPYDFGGGGGRGYQGTVYGSFNELYDKISSNIFKINNSASSLDRAMKQIGSSKDCVQLRDRIHATEQNTNQVIQETAKVFRQFSQVCKHSDRQQKLQFERLKNEFQETLQRYNTLQKKVAEKVKSSVPLSSQVKKPPQDLVGWGDDDDEARLLEEQAREEKLAQLQTQDVLIDTDLALIQEREDRIRQLEGDILDINDIFRDLATLVHEQGEVIDTIEANVEQAYDQVDAGNQQLVQAARYQRKFRKKMCILVIILTVIAAIVTLIIVLSLKKK